MRWQPFAIAAGLAAPPVALAIAVWPSTSAAERTDGATGEPEAELALGDSDRGTTNGVGSTDYLIVGPGFLRVDVDGPGFDPTLTFVDPESGEQVDYNDDTNGLNPALAVELEDGESVLAQVRSLGGPPGGAFTITVSELDDGAQESVLDAEIGAIEEQRRGPAGGVPTTIVIGDG